MNKRSIICLLMIGMITGCAPNLATSSSSFSSESNDVSVNESSSISKSDNKEIIFEDFGFYGTTINRYYGESSTVTIPALNPSGEAVTAIGKHAFQNCSFLTSVTIPSTVKSLGEACFEGCSSLESIVIPDEVTLIGPDAFYGCSSLNSIKLSENLLSIGYRAFYGVDSLLVILLPKTVEMVGVNAFKGKNLHIYSKSLDISEFNWSSSWNSSKCPFMSGVDDAGVEKGYIYYLKNECATIDGYVGEDVDVEIPATLGGANVTYIARAFEYCDFIESVVVPNTVKEIWYHAFANCYSLKNVVLPEGLESLQSEVFYNCTSLKNVNLPESLINFGTAVFWNCSSLETISIPKQIIVIPNTTFYECSSLKSIKLHPYINQIGQYSFEGCSSLETIFIPSSVTFIGVYAFNLCSKLHIYCEAMSFPSSWSPDFNPSNCPITWGYNE